jgi:hypothetical protein
VHELTERCVLETLIGHRIPRSCAASPIIQRARV